MAETSIGKLNVKIAADASGFQNVLARSEKQLSAFAAKAASPFTMGLGIGALAGNPLASLLGPIQQIADKIPGLERFQIFLDPTKHAAAMEKVKDDTLEIARAAQSLNIDPQFLKALRVTAGPLEDQLMPGLRRLIIAQGQLRKGGEEALTTGGRSATTMLEKWGFDPQEIANLTSEQWILKFADQVKAAKDPSEQFAMVTDLMGRKMGALTPVFAQGSAAIKKWLDVVKELGIDSPEQVALAKTIAAMKKIHELRMEAIRDKEFERVGGMRMIAIQEMGEAEGLGGWLKGFLRFTQTFPAKGFPFGGLASLAIPRLAEPEALKKQREAAEAFAAAAGVPPEMVEIRTAADDAADAIERMNKALDDQVEIARLTKDGWGDVAHQIIELTHLMSQGGLAADAMVILDRLAGVQAGKDAEKAAKDLQHFTDQVMSKASGLSSSPFAAAAMAGSREAADAFNRQSKQGGVGDLVLDVQQILALMKKPAVSPEMQQNIRDAWTELQKLNQNLGQIEPVLNP